MSILPKNIFETTSNGNGGFITREWSYGDYQEMKFINLLVMIIVVLIVGSIASGILLFLTIYAYEEKNVSYNVVGAIIASYLLYDIYHQWIVSILLSIITNEREMKYVVHLNTAFLLAHSFMALYRNNIYNWIEENHQKSSKSMYGLIISIVLFVSIICSLVLAKPIIKQLDNLKIETTKNL